MHPDFQTAVAFHRSGRLAEAEELFRRILTAEPDNHPALYHQGVIAHRQGRLTEAQSHLAEAEQLAPGQAAYAYMRGIVLHDMKRLEEAARCIERACTIKPDFFQAWNNLGLVLQDAGRLEAAEQALNRALQIKDDYAAAWNNLAAVFKEQGRLDEAEQALNKAIAIDPANAQGHLNLARLHKKRERYTEAIACLERARELAPGLPEIHLERGIILCYAGDLSAGLDSIRQAMAIKADARSHSIYLFLRNYVPGLSPQSIYAEHLIWSRQYAQPLAARMPPPPNTPAPERRLRLGYVSADFRWHAVASFLQDILAGHDRSQFEVYCYASVERPDTLTRWFESQADVWRDVLHSHDEALAEQVRSDGIDILVDLSGHTWGNRLLAFAQRPAPVQATYLGYLGSTGLETMDYRITDAVESPPGQSEAFHSEKLARLPDGMWCYRPPEEAPPVSPLPAVRNGYITFASFNNSNKVNADVAALWSRLLMNLPDSRLIMACRGDEAVRRHLHELFSRHGVDPERIELRPPASFGDYLAQHGEVDIHLDTFPYTGGATTCHALWMGAPVVTLSGNRPFARSGASILAMLGLEHWVAASPEAYIDIASGLAKDVDALADIRGGLRRRMQASPLMDTARFVRNLESSYRLMWRTWCAQQTAHGTTST